MKDINLNWHKKFVLFFVLFCGINSLILEVSGQNSAENVGDSLFLIQKYKESAHEYKRELYFGDNKCVVSRLNPVFFDYDAMGIPVTMNYYSEAAEDGNPVKH